MLAHHGAVESVKLFRVPGSTRHKVCFVTEHTMSGSEELVGALSKGPAMYLYLRTKHVFLPQNGSIQRQRRVGRHCRTSAQPHTARF